MEYVLKIQYFNACQRCFPHIPKKNDVTEMKNQTLVEMARFLMQIKCIPTKLWEEPIYYSNYLLNLLLTREFINMNPIKKWNGRKPSIVHLITFLYVSWAHINDNYRNKFNPKSRSYIMMDYFDDSKSYILSDPINGISY